MALSVLAFSGLFFLGHALQWFFAKTKIPDILILIGLGYLIGPFYGFVNPEDLGKVGGIFSTIAMVTILYEGGLNLKAKDLFQSAVPSLILSLATFGFFVVLATLAVALIAGQSWSSSLLVGIGLGSISSAIVLPMIKQLPMEASSKTILSLESAFTDVLAIVFFIVIANGLKEGSLSMKSLLLGVGPASLISIVAGLFIGLVWSVLKTRVNAISGIAYSTEASAALTYGLLEILGFNGALAVLAFGFSLANIDLLPKIFKKNLETRPVTEAEAALLSELVLFLKTFFFIYLGLLIQFRSLSIVLLSAVLCCLIIVTRYLSIKVTPGSQNWTQSDKQIILTFGPRGLACAVLATIPIALGLEGGEFVQEIIFCTIPLTIVLASVAAFVISSKIPKVVETEASLTALEEE